MSNSRLFCLVWAIWNGVALFMELAGAEKVIHGVDGMIARQLVGLSWGVAAVALWGDRDRRKV